MSALLFTFRTRSFRDFIMWPVSKRLLGLDYSEIVTIDQTIRMKVSLALLDMHSRLILFYSHFVPCPWEPATVRLFKVLAQNAKHIVIAGANIGYYPLLASKYSCAKVCAFEPVPRIKEICEENLALNNTSIKIYPEALSDHSGMADIFIHGGDSSLMASNKNATVTSRVKTISLDEFCQAHTFMPDLILLDIEGFEHIVFKGSQKILSDGNCNIIFEVNFEELARSQTPVETVLTPLKSNGYQIFAIQDDYNLNNIFSNETSIKLIPFNKEYYSKRPSEFINCLATKDVNSFKKYM